MNRLISITLLLTTCALCFFAGYKLGQDSLGSTETASTANVETPSPSLEQLTDTGSQPQLTVEPLVVVTAATDPQHSPLALRAQKTMQTFFDTKERKLIAEILQVNADSLRIRRQSDGQELDLPVAMLSSEDRAFAAYLWAQQPKEVATPSSQSMEDLIWDELFK